MYEYRFQLAELVLRVFLGVLFLAQGYDKVVRLKIQGVIDTFRAEMESKNIPHFLIVGAAYFTSVVEFMGGLFLILGFMKYTTLSLLGADLLLVTCAFSILQPMWDMRFVFPRLLILIALFLTPEQWGLFSIDHFLRHHLHIF